MAYHIEQNPKAKVTFNFVPVLLDQLEEYAQQLDSGSISDPLLALLAEPNLDKMSEEQRTLILESCFRSNHEKMVTPFPSYHRLHAVYNLLHEIDHDTYAYLSEQYFADLITWYHLSWMGESIRRESELVVSLMAQGAGYTPAQRRQLFELVCHTVISLIPRYRALVANGQIEISTTPHYHPILPLLLDFNAALEASPGMTLPDNRRYPGGATRAHRHIELAVTSHTKRFGKSPSGVWPAEGGVSQTVLEQLADEGFKWAATGESVLANSLRNMYGETALFDDKRHLYKPYHIIRDGHSILCFFRDDRLSDKIGFEYSKWHGRDAVDDFIRELEKIYESFPSDETPVVSIILDGENAWEYYPYNAYYFLTELYQALVDHPNIEMTTFTDVIRHIAAETGDVTRSDANITPGQMTAITAGSWVYGTFSTWIGDPAKNRAWDLLCEAKQNYDLVMASGRLSQQEKLAAEKQLGDCEGSDWFWWFGDYNPSGSVQSFDLLFRRNLINLYHLLKLPAPSALNYVISRGGGDAEGGGTMRRGQE